MTSEPIRKPPPKVVTTIRLPAELRSEMDALVARSGMTRTDWLTDLVAAAVAADLASEVTATP